MSRFIRKAKRVGTTPTKFQFDITVQSLIYTPSTEVSAETPMSVVFQRGPKMASTMDSNLTPQGTVEWDQTLSLVVTMYRDKTTNVFQPKSANLMVRRRTWEKGKGSVYFGVGVAELQLVNYIGMGDTSSGSILLPLNRCAPAAAAGSQIRVSISSKWLSHLTDADETMSDMSGMSGYSLDAVSFQASDHSKQFQKQQQQQQQQQQHDHYHQRGCEEEEAARDQELDLKDFGIEEDNDCGDSEAASPPNLRVGGGGGWGGDLTSLREEEEDETAGAGNSSSNNGGTQSAPIRGEGGGGQKPNKGRGLLKRTSSFKHRFEGLKRGGATTAAAADGGGALAEAEARAAEAEAEAGALRRALEQRDKDMAEIERALIAAKVELAEMRMQEDAMVQERQQLHERLRLYGTTAAKMELALLRPPRSKGN